MKKFFINIAVLALIFNAGLDIGHHIAKRRVEGKVQAALSDVAGEFGTTAKVNGCYNVSDLGWVCDMTATELDGKEQHRGSHLFTYDELNEL